MNDRIATCLWLVNPAVIHALDNRFGIPVDSYVNGSQVWLLDNGPRQSTLEWRLHPVSGYTKPNDVSHYDIWELVTTQVVDENSDIQLGNDTRKLHSLWEGLECFPAFEDSMEPPELAQACGEALGIPAEFIGMVDHETIGDTWEKSHRSASIVSMLRDQLTSTA